MIFIIKMPLFPRNNSSLRCLYSPSRALTLSLSVSPSATSLGHTTPKSWIWACTDSILHIPKWQQFQLPWQVNGQGSRGKSFDHGGASSIPHSTSTYLQVALSPTQLVFFWVLGSRWSWERLVFFPHDRRINSNHGWSCRSRHPWGARTILATVVASFCSASWNPGSVVTSRKSPELSKLCPFMLHLNLSNLQEGTSSELQVSVKAKWVCLKIGYL